MQDLYRFAGKSVVYLAKVDRVRPLYKYGISHDIYKRILKSHRNTFPVFDLELVRVTPQREHVERLLTSELCYLGLHHKEVFKGKTQRELILLPQNSEYDIEDVKHLIDRIIAYTDREPLSPSIGLDFDMY